MVVGGKASLLTATAEDTDMAVRGIALRQAAAVVAGDTGTAARGKASPLVVVTAAIEEVAQGRAAMVPTAAQDRADRVA